MKPKHAPFQRDTATVDLQLDKKHTAPMTCCHACCRISNSLPAQLAWSQNVANIHFDKAYVKIKTHDGKCFSYLDTASRQREGLQTGQLQSQARSRPAARSADTLQSEQSWLQRSEKKWQGDTRRARRPAIPSSGSELHAAGRTSILDCSDSKQKEVPREPASHKHKP